MVQITIGSDASIIDKRKEHSLRHSEDALVYLFHLGRKLWRTRGQLAIATLPRESRDKKNDGAAVTTANYFSQAAARRDFVGCGMMRRSSNQESVVSTPFALSLVGVATFLRRSVVVGLHQHCA
jgi:hypothetical protein